MKSKQRFSKNINNNSPITRLKHCPNTNGDDCKKTSIDDWSDDETLADIKYAQERQKFIRANKKYVRNYFTRKQKLAPRKYNSKGQKHKNIVELFVACPQQCEFCEKSFKNKYEIMVHNASHIIIPLIKQSIHQCSECLFVFETIELLSNHKTMKHNLELPLPKTEPVVRELSNVSLLENEVISNLLSDCKVNIVPLQCFLQLDTNSTSNSDESCKAEELLNNRLHEDVDLGVDTDEDSIPLQFLLDDKNINEELKDMSWLDETIAQFEGNLDNLIVPDVIDNLFQTNLSSIELNVKEEILQEDFFANSIDKDIKLKFEKVGNNELLHPGLFRCKRCKERFPNRFELIQHEASHIVIKNRLNYHPCPFCDKCIAGGYFALKRHIKKNHNDEELKVRYVKKCEICHLKYYNYHRHCKFYHKKLFCRPCCKMFRSAEEKKKHMKASSCRSKNKIKHMLYICELCSVFHKKHNRYYTYMTFENMFMFNQKRACDHCNKMHRKLKCFKKIDISHRKSFASKIQFEDSVTKCKKKVYSNKERLLNIQKRLKNMNRYS